MMPLMPTWAIKVLPGTESQWWQSIHPAQFPEMFLVKPKLFYNNKHWHLWYILPACYKSLVHYTLSYLTLRTVRRWDCHQSFIYSWEHRLRQAKCSWPQDLWLQPRLEVQCPNPRSSVHFTVAQTMEFQRREMAWLDGTFSQCHNSWTHVGG